MRAIDIQPRSRPPRTCTVRVGWGLLDALADDLATRPPGAPLFVVSDERVAALHGAAWVRGLVERGLPARLLTFPEGEASKSREQKARLEDRLVEAGAGRDCALIAFGGGVTGDLAGFLASTWQRGVPLVQVPTTLLAMVDASVGGKTAVNVPAAKNLIGTFHAPWAVWADLSLLATLSDGCFREGWAEVVKAAVIADAALFERLEADAEALLERRPEPLEAAVADAVGIKGRIVAEDELESGPREALNFGHTVAHALEAKRGFALRHGAAVAIGMCVEARLAADATGFPRDDVERLRRLLIRFGLPTRLPDGVDGAAMLDAAARDKKVRGGRLRFALPQAIGAMPSGASPAVEVSRERLVEALDAIRRDRSSD